MRFSIPFTALLPLAACAPDTTPDEFSNESAPEGDAPVMAADGAQPDGRYRTVDEAGAVLIEELRPDGTYIFTDEEGVILEEGDYVQKSSEELCFTALTEGADEKCYKEEIGEEGVWRTTDPVTGEVAVIERIDAE